MFRLRSVAGFAIHARMLARMLGRCHIVMAVLTDLMAGKRYRTSSNFCQGIAAKVSVLAKAVRNEGGAQNQKNRQSCYEYRRQPKKMFGVLELIHGSIPLGLPVKSC